MCVSACMDAPVTVVCILGVCDVAVCDACVCAVSVVRVQCAYYHSAPSSSSCPGTVSHAVNANVNAPATWPHSRDGLTGIPRTHITPNAANINITP